MEMNVAFGFVMCLHYSATQPTEKEILLKPQIDSRDKSWREKSIICALVAPNDLFWMVSLCDALLLWLWVWKTMYFQRELQSLCLVLNDLSLLYLRIWYVLNLLQRKVSLDWCCMSNGKMCLCLAEISLSLISIFFLFFFIFSAYFLFPPNNKLKATEEAESYKRSNWEVKSPLKFTMHHKVWLVT